jgi:3-deoxy-D-manno-octulosonic-acid transferase
MGPHTFNFAQAAQLSEEAGAALRVQDMQEGVRAAVQLAADPARHESAVRSARAFALAHQGAARKTAQAVLALAQRR